MIAQVIPAKKLPRQTSDFDYAVDDGLLAVARGSLVLIPWRGRPTPGVVRRTVASSTVPQSKLKSLLLTLAVPHLPEDWMKTLEWAEQRYLTSPGTIAGCFLPTPPKKTIKAQEEATAVTLSPEEPPVPVPPGQGKRDVTVKLYASPQEKWIRLKDAVSGALRADRSVIVLAPHLEDVKQALSHVATVEGIADRQAAAIHGQQAAGKLWSNWLDSLEGRVSCVVGSRMAVMAPLSNLGLIVVLEAESPDHKQYDQNPRYDARAMAKVRADAAGADLLVLTQAPRTEDYQLTGAKSWTDVSSVKKPSGVVLADISAWGKGWSGPLAPLSLERIGQSLQDGQNALIYHDRLGTAGALACADCRRVSRCPTCSLAMSVSLHQLQCRRCGRSEPQPNSCPGCGGQRLRLVGWGTAAVENFLQKNFPGVTIRRFDGDTGKMTAPLPTGAGIVIGARGLVHDLSERFGGRFGTVIVTAAEDLLRRPGFRATEEAWGLVRKLRCLASDNGDAAGEVVIQTVTPDDARIRSLADDDRTFLEKEASARAAAGYPPAGRLIVITAAGVDEAAARKAAYEAHRQLEPACRDNGRQTVLSPPFRPLRPLTHGRWRQIMAIKAPEIGPGLTAALRLLPDEFIIETDPETPI